jgi:hypothetical protein
MVWAIGARYDGVGLAFLLCCPDVERVVQWVMIRRSAELGRRRKGRAYRRHKDGPGDQNSVTGTPLDASATGINVTGADRSNHTFGRIAGPGAPPGQLPLARVLDQLGLASRLKGSGLQRRGPCPLHRGDGRGKSFSVHLGDHVFQCFDAACAKKGDVIDLWAAVHGLSLRQAALDLVQTFGLEPAPGGTEKRNG